MKTEIWLINPKGEMLLGAFRLWWNEKKTRKNEKKN